MVTLVADEQCDMAAPTPQVATEHLLNLLSDYNITIKMKRNNLYCENTSALIILFIKHFKDIEALVQELWLRTIR